MERARITITLRGKEVEVVQALAKSSGRKPGDIVAEMVHELLESIMPAFDTDNEAQAMRIILRNGLNKLGKLLDEPLG